MNLPTTELDAVNVMLSVIGQEPVNSLEDARIGDAFNALSILRETSITVQTEGWHWNCDENVVLIPDAEGRITFPAETLKAYVIAAYHGYPDVRVSKRGPYLYNMRDRTYTFPPEFSLRVETISWLPWDYLPEAAKRYIFMRAARVFAARAVGSDNMVVYTQQDEATARAELERDDNQQGAYSMLDSPRAGHMVRRRQLYLPL